jgi:hypothetical protein
MSSERRIRASRANGARSRGPATPEGKQRSSYNAVRHGLLATCVVLPGESAEAFHALVDQFVERFQPLDNFEFNMIEEMAAHYWRMRRAWAVETVTLRDSIAAQRRDDPVERIAGAMGKLAGDPLLQLLHRYETRLHRMYHRVMRNLLQLREEIPNLPDEPDDSQPIAETLPFPARDEANLPNEPNPTNEHLDSSPAPAPAPYSSPSLIAPAPITAIPEIHGAPIPPPSPPSGCYPGDSAELP